MRSFLVVADRVLVIMTEALAGSQRQRVCSERKTHSLALRACIERLNLARLEFYFPRLLLMTADSGEPGPIGKRSDYVAQSLRD